MCRLTVPPRVGRDLWNPTSRQRSLEPTSRQRSLELVGVFVFRVMWSVLMTSAISCPLWSSVYECQRVECAFTSPVRTECGTFLMYCMQCCMSVSAVL